MTNILTHALTLTAALFLALPQSARADHGNFHCQRLPFLHENAVAAIKRLSHNKTMSVIVKQYAELWEDADIRRTCDAASAGNPADFSCHQGRRNWDEIQAMIPKELFSLDAKALRTHQLNNQKKRAQESPREAVYQHCAALGVVKR